MRINLKQSYVQYKNVALILDFFTLSKHYFKASDLLMHLVMVKGVITYKIKCFVGLFRTL